jgi:cysteinyl-tRNA synthetase
MKFLGSPAGGHALFTPGPSLDDIGELDVWRRIVLLDVLGRALGERGQGVRLAVGVADMDDRALAGARKAHLSPQQFRSRGLEVMIGYAQALGVSADIRFALAGDSLDRALELTRRLLSRGRAYEKLRSVYFDVTRDKNYGQASGVDATGMNFGHTVDLDDYVKENPADFTLLKRASLQDLKLGDVLETQWGKVRPSWFLQMAAAALDSLGGVSVMLVGESQRFPHLDNFSAIWSAGANVRPQNWMVAQPVVRREGGAPSLDQVLTSAGSGIAVRLWLLSSSHLKSLACTPKSLSMWRKNQHRLQDAYVAATMGDGPERARSEFTQALYDVKTALATSLDNNLNLAHFWPVLFRLAKMINGRTDLSREEGDAAREQLLACNRVLGFLDKAQLPLARQEWPEEAAALVERRERARESRDFALADELRDELARAGLRLEDHQQGTRLYRI